MKTSARNTGTERRKTCTTQEDSARDGHNWYTYCGNNPLLFIDTSGKWPSLAQIATGIAVVAMAAIFAAAVVASAGSVGVLAAAAVGSLGASGAVMAGASTVATVGTYEAVTGENYLAETVFQGNYEAYNTTETILYMAGGVAIEAGATAPAPSKSAGSTQTTYKNNRPNEPFRSVRNVRVAQVVNGKYTDARGYTMTKTYDYVVMPDGTVHIGAKDIGHINLAQGQDVLYAGQLHFNHSGHLASWSNASGHYKPGAYTNEVISYLNQAGLQDLSGQNFRPY